MQSKAEPQLRSHKGKYADDAKGRKQAARCMTCFSPVVWKEEGHSWVPYDYATDAKHRCKND